MNRISAEYILSPLNYFANNRLLYLFELFSEVILYDIVYLSETFPYFWVKMIFYVVIGPMRWIKTVTYCEAAVQSQPIYYRSCREARTWVAQFNNPSVRLNYSDQRLPYTCNKCSEIPLFTLFSVSSLEAELLGHILSYGTPLLNFMIIPD